MIKQFYSCCFAFTVYNQLNALHFYNVAIRENWTTEFSMQKETFFSNRDNRLLFINFLNDLTWTESPAGEVTAPGSHWQQHEYFSLIVRKEEPAASWLEKFTRASIFDGFFLLRHIVRKDKRRVVARGWCGVKVTAWKFDICSNWSNWTRLRLIYLIFSF